MLISQNVKLFFQVTLKCCADDRCNIIWPLCFTNNITPVNRVRKKCNFLKLFDKDMNPYLFMWRWSDHKLSRYKKKLPQQKTQTPISNFSLLYESSIECIWPLKAAGGTWLTLVFFPSGVLKLHIRKENGISLSQCLRVLRGCRWAMRADVGCAAVAAGSSAALRLSY